MLVTMLPMVPPTQKQSEIVPFTSFENDMGPNNSKKHIQEMDQKVKNNKSNAEEMNP